MAEREIGVHPVGCQIALMMFSRQEKKIPLPSIDRLDQRHLVHQPGIQSGNLLEAVDRELLEVARPFLLDPANREASPREPLAERKNFIVSNGSTRLPPSLAHPVSLFRGERGRENRFETDAA